MYPAQRRGACIVSATGCDANLSPAHDARGDLATEPLRELHYGVIQICFAQRSVTPPSLSWCDASCIGISNWLLIESSNWLIKSSAVFAAKCARFSLLGRRRCAVHALSPAEEIFGCSDPRCLAGRVTCGLPNIVTMSKMAPVAVLFDLSIAVDKKCWFLQQRYIFRINFLKMVELFYQLET